MFCAEIVQKDEYLCYCFWLAMIMWVEVFQVAEGIIKKCRPTYQCNDVTFPLQFDSCEI